MVMKTTWHAMTRNGNVMMVHGNPMVAHGNAVSKSWHVMEKSNGVDPCRVRRNICLYAPAESKGVGLLLWISRFPAMTS